MFADAVEKYLRAGKPAAWNAVGAAAATLTVGELAAAARALGARTEVPAGIAALPGHERERFEDRRAQLLGDVVASALAARHDDLTDAALLELLDDPRTATTTCTALFRGASPREGVLRAIAGHFDPADRLFAAAVEARRRLGDDSAVGAFANLDDESAAYVGHLVLLLAWSRTLTNPLADLVVRHWAATRHTLCGPLTHDTASPDVLLRLLETAPDEYLDESIAKGLSRGTSPADRARLAAFLAGAPPRAFAATLAKLAKGPPGAAPKSLGVVATDGAPVVLGRAAVLSSWQGALPEPVAAGDYHDACTSPLLTRDGAHVLVISSHESRVEVLSPGRGDLLLVVWGDPAEVLAQRASLTLEPVPCDLGVGPHALLDAAFPLRDARRDADRTLPITPKGAHVQVSRASTSSFEVLRVQVVRP